MSTAEHLAAVWPLTCILLLVWHVSSSSYAMYPPPHRLKSVSAAEHLATGMYPPTRSPPHMQCILLLIVEEQKRPSRGAKET